MQYFRTALKVMYLNEIVSAPKKLYRHNIESYNITVQHSHVLVIIALYKSTLYLTLPYS